MGAGIKLRRSGADNPRRHGRAIGRMALGEQFPEVLQAARLGAEWAWRALHRNLAPSIIGYLDTRGASDPEDLAGEVFFLRLFRDLPRFEGGEGEFRAFAFTIARHRLIDERRCRSRRPEEAMRPILLRRRDLRGTSRARRSRV